MTLRTLIAWAMLNNIDLDDSLAIGEPFKAMKLQGVVYNKTTKQVILMDKETTEPKVIEVIAACQCPRTEAIRYLQQSNWNVPLAIVTYRREQR